MFDFLLSADMMVDDADAVAATLVKRVGILEHPNWRQAFDDHPYVAWFLRVHKSLAVAPTRIEPQGHLDAPNLGDPVFPAYLHSAAEFVGLARPIKTHGTVLVTRQLDRFISGLARRHVPFRIAPMTADMPWERLWIGVTPERPAYDPSWDAGLCVEVLPTWPLQMPEATFDAPDPVDPPPGSLVRVVSKEFLVRDLDDAVRRLATNIPWEPVGPIETFTDEGFRRARFGFELPHSAMVDLIEPTRWDSPAGRYLHSWGPGPYTIRIAVHGLDAKAGDLTDRGTTFALLEANGAVGRRLRIDPADLDGLLIELVEFQPKA